VLGGLEADSNGNVNVHTKFELQAYVGPGGFVDLTHCAKVIIFCLAFEARGRLRASPQGLHVLRQDVANSDDS